MTVDKPFWRSLDELRDTPAFRQFVDREFGESAFAPLDSVGRRRFLQLMGASLALAGCRWEEEQILPHTRRPAGHVPGKAKPYRTALEVGGHGVGLEVSVVDGRPIKIDGNPLHPASRGGVSATLGARILELYDPDRSQAYAQRNAGTLNRSTREAFLGALRDARELAAAKQGDGLVIIADATASPTFARLRAELTAQLPKMRWLAFEPLGRQHERDGIAAAFGRALRPLPAMDQARLVVSLDADPLGRHPTALANLRGWAEHRAPESSQGNRVYAVESAMSTTGMNADHRLPLPSRDVGAFTLALAERVGKALGKASPWAAPAFEHPWLAILAEELLQQRGASLLFAGDAQPAVVHAAVAWLHHQLGAIGKTVRYLDAPAAADPPSRLREIASEPVETLVVLGCNLAYEAPSDVDVAALFQRAKRSFVASLYRDETATLATWHAPLAHPLASWGDTRAFDGTVALQQPLIAPLFDGTSAIELLAELTGRRDPSGQDLVRLTFERVAMSAPTVPTVAGKLPVLVPDLGERRWRRALADGRLDGSGYAAVTPTLKTTTLVLVAPPKPRKGQLEIQLFDDGKVEAGRLANNAWLQETPEARTKLVWDNALLVSPGTAADLGVNHEDVVRLEASSGSVELPVYVMPGQARGTGSVALGYGRRRAGTVGGDEEQGIAVGVDVRPLRHSDALWLTTATVTPTGRRFALATTQDHHAIDELGKQETERRSHHLVRQVSREELADNPQVVRERDHHPPLRSLWQKRDAEGHQWGLSVDLSKCVGCNACMVACQSENNVPVVGKDEVIKGREMHWIRIDRYFQGDPEAPRVAQQPLACAHCENAPCEQVCPVGATVHSEEGLNDMVYNRCIGTRYCANNCPYKVRRFNFLDYHDDLDQGGEANGRVRLMVHNPDVTVRSRGVMEKCTYCVQRIKGGKHEARIEGRPLRDGDITPACAQACPTQAIVFGDLADPKSRVSELHALERSYVLLEELNIKPRTRYLARVTNDNPALEGEREEMKAHG